MHIMTTVSNGQTTQTYHHIERIPLFQLSQSLFQGPYTMKSTQLSFPFSFTLPTESTFVRRQRHRRKNTPGFTQGPQPLPPSFSLLDGSGVSYWLAVTMNPASFIRSHATKLPIYVIQTSSQPSPTPLSRTTQVNKQRWKSRSLRPQKYTFKQKMAHILTHDPNLKRPSISFVPKAYMPSSATIIQHLPLAVSILYQISGPTDPTNPTLILKKVTLLLKQYTSILANNAVNYGKAMVAQADLSVDKQLAMDGTPFEFSNAQGSGGWPLSLASSKAFPSPTFSTYTINHWYKLTMVVLLQHPETLHQFKFKAKTDFKILPLFMRYGHVGGGSVRELEMNRIVPVVEEQLPAYMSNDSKP